MPDAVSMPSTGAAVEQVMAMKESNGRLTAQAAIMDSVLENQQVALAQLMKLMGLGQNIDISA